MLVCQYCDREFSQRSSLTRHIRSGACEGLGTWDNPGEAIQQLSDSDDSIPAVAVIEDGEVVRVSEAPAGAEYGVALHGDSFGLVFGPDE